jgi:hypothetical protein
MRATQFVKTELAENYPKHQDLSGVSTDKLKAYLARQGQQSVPGEGGQVRRVQAELQRRKLTGDPAPQHYRDELAKAAAEYRKKQGVAEGSTDTVMFEIDSENAYNHVMKQFGSVVGWDGDTMVAPRKYWGSIQELAYSAGGEATEVGNEQGMAEGSEPQVGDAVYYGKRLVGWFKGYSEHGKIITEPNYEEMGDEYSNRDVYWDPQDKITIKPEQGVAEGDTTKKLSGATPAPAPNPYLKDILIQHIDEVRHFVQTGYIDPTRPLFQELYEYFANEIPDSVRRNPGRLVRRIGDMIAPYAKFYAGTQNMNEQGVAEGSEFDKWANDRAASQLYKLKPATTWEVSFDYGPHQSDSVKVKARSAQEAVEKVETAAEKKGRSIMVNWAKPAEQGMSEGNYDRDDYYNARQGREYGRDMTATGWGGDNSATRRADIFKGQSKRLPADPFARTSGAVPTAGTGRIHSTALPGEMDEANDQKIGGRYDADDFDDMVARLKKLAGSGPMKTVYDPDRRVYRNMPTAVQPAQQPKKAPR